MYTRSYEDERITPIPEGYSGVAFGDDGVGVEDTGDSEVVSVKPRGGLFSLFEGGIGDVFKGGIFRGKLGVEEILIIATAAFLFFNKDGDKECALMLLLLLFI